MSAFGVRKGDVFKRFEFSTAARFMTDSNFLPEKYAFYTGAGFYFRDFELKAAYKIPEVRFSATPAWNNIALGAAFSLKDLLDVPLVVKGGSMSLGGSLHKLKNPTLASASYPLAVPSAAVSGVTASLPSFYGQAKTPAIGAEFLYRNQMKTAVPDKIGAAVFWGTDNVFAASALTEFSARGRAAFGFAFTAANTPVSPPRSYLGRKQRESNPFPDGMWSGSMQAAFRSPVFRTKCTVFLFQSVRVPASPAFASENRLHIGRFNLNVAGFYALSENTLTASGRPLKTLSQIKLNPQFDFPVSGHAARLKTGLNLLLEEKKRRPTKRKSGSREFTLSLSAGTAIEWKDYTSSVSCTAGGFYLGDSAERICAGIIPPEKRVFENVSYGLRWVTVRKVPPHTFLAAAVEVTPPNAQKRMKTRSKLAASVKLRKKHSNAGEASVRGAISVNTDGERVHGNAEIAGAFKWKKDKIVLNALLGIKYRF